MRAIAKKHPTVTELNEGSWLIPLTLSLTEFTEFCQVLVENTCAYRVEFFEGEPPE